MTPWKQDWKENRYLYLIFLPAGLYFLIFHYAPMAGIVTAFQDFSISKGIFKSDWVGIQNFVDLFTGDTFGKVMRNTMAMALLNLTIGFVAPILLALLLSEISLKRFRRIGQTFTYMPYFVAAVVVTYLVKEFLGANGALTQVLSVFGLKKQNWLANRTIPVFWLINCFTGIWQSAGFSSIIYFTAISNISPDLYEAAAIDGVTYLQRIIHITLPSITPTVIIMFTLQVGLVFTLGFDKILLLYMPLTYDVADVLTTYTYRMAFGQGTNYGLSAASGLFQSVVATALLLVSNWLAKKAASSSLF
jgi:ABC-type polysaccharide transport system permease subunit